MAEKNKDVAVEETVKEEVKPKEEAAKKEAPKKKTVKQLVKEVVAGQHGTGRERMRSLGDQYEEVQHEVNQLIKKGEIR